MLCSIIIVTFKAEEEEEDEEVQNEDSGMAHVKNLGST